MKKWLMIAVCLLVVLAGALVVTYNSLLSKNFLVAKIEESIDSRVQIGGLGVSLFSIPAKVVISDVIITERDDAARDGVPHDERDVLKDGKIRVDEIRFDVTLQELFSKEIKVNKLIVTGAHADLVMNEAGELNLSSLFATPPETLKEKERKEKEGLNAKDSPAFITALDRFTLEDSSFDLVIEKTGLEIVGREVNLGLSDIKVDPNALEKVNEAHLEFAAQLEAFSSKKGRQKYGQIGLDGPARVRLFDPATGSLAPDAEIDFAIDSSSYVSSKAPYIVKLWDVTDKLVKIGVKAEPLSDRLTFGRDRKLNARYAGDRLDLREPVSLMVDDWEFVLNGGTWMELGTEQHRSGVRLIASAKVSEWVREHLQKLTDLVPEKNREQVKQEFLAQVFVEDRLNLKVSTDGALSDPKVKLETRLPDAEKMVKDYAKTKVIDFLLDKLGE